MINSCHSGLDPESIQINTDKIAVICGPTASGKTGLALQLAKVLSKANILSVDSRQAYRGLDIITGKDIPEGLSPKIKIFGHDLFDPDEKANLADFVRYSQKIILDSQITNTPLIIVGGTGLYLKAITQDLSHVSIPPNPALRRKLEKLSLEELQTRLKKTDQKKYSSLNHSDVSNPRRLIRALEISSNHRHCEPAVAGVAIHPLGHSRESGNLYRSFHWIGLMPNKETIKSKVHKRVLERIKKGAITEVKKLLKNYPDQNLPIYSSLGVSFVIDYLNKKITKDRLVDLWTNAEIDYARRQIVWFKKQPGIIWYDISNA